MGGSRSRVRLPCELPEATRMAALGGELPSLEAVAARIRDGHAKNIVVMMGAGCSVSCGIPDFRSPGTGLYDNLQKYNLERPEDAFCINHFDQDPAVFTELARELFPGNFQPSPTHAFLKVLADKGVLRRCFTQNIDCLERLAGVPSDKLVEAHGSFARIKCRKCEQFSEAGPYLRALRATRDVPGPPDAPRCEACGGLLKPTIVFFGEELPGRFARCRGEDSPVADLLLVMGTSLTVGPFNQLLDMVSDECPRVLMNRVAVAEADEPRWSVLEDAERLQAEAAAEEERLLAAGQKPPRGRPVRGSVEDRLADALEAREGMRSTGFRFNFPDNYRDVLVLGDCDAATEQLAALLGWEAELEAAKASCATMQGDDEVLSILAAAGAQLAADDEAAEEAARAAKKDKLKDMLDAEAPPVAAAGAGGAAARP